VDGFPEDLSIYGQEFVATTWRLAKMNLAIRGIDANLGDRSDDSFHRDHFPDLRADFILANPPFNKDDWFSDALRDDVRWAYGLPPAATPTTRGCSTSSTTSPRMVSQGSCLPTGRCPRSSRVNSSTATPWRRMISIEMSASP
jgi:N-6 DNA Methylase